MDELLLRYLDSQTTPEEEVQLARELRSSRAARRRFARVSRLHGNLAGVLTETRAPAPPTLAELSGELIALALRLRTAPDPALLEERLALIENPDVRTVLAAFATNQPCTDLPASKDPDVLEILYLCLALGLEVPARKARMEELLRELRPRWSLSPHWRPPDRARVPAWTPVAACVLFVAMLYVFLSALIGSSAEAVIDKLK